MSGTWKEHVTLKDIIAVVVVAVGVGGSLANTTFRANAADKTNDEQDVRLNEHGEEHKGINKKLGTLVTQQAVMAQAVKSMEQSAKESREDTKEALRRIERAVVR